MNLPIRNLVIEHVRDVPHNTRIKTVDGNHFDYNCIVKVIDKDSGLEVFSVGKRSGGFVSPERLGTSLFRRLNEGKDKSEFYDMVRLDGKEKMITKHQSLGMVENSEKKKESEVIDRCEDLICSDKEEDIWQTVKLPTEVKGPDNKKEVINLLFAAFSEVNNSIAKATNIQNSILELIKTYIGKEVH